MQAVIHDAATDNRALLAVTYEDGEVYLPMPNWDPPRAVILGKRLLDVLDGGPYVAFFTYVDPEDWRRAQDKHVAPEATTAERLLWAIFGNLDLEPELPCELMTADGGRVVRVDFNEHWPHHTLYVPEGCIT